MKYVVLAVSLLGLSAPLQASGLSGDWKGSIELPGEQMPAFLRLRDNHGAITGQAGPSEEQLFAIKRASLKDNRLKIETAADSPVLLVFELALEGDELAGRVFEDGALVGTVTLRRTE